MDDYTSKIVNKLDKYNNFLVVSTESLSEEENKQLQDEFNQMVTDNVNIIQGSGYNCIERNVQSNKPGAGNFIISITYLHVDR